MIDRIQCLCMAGMHTLSLSLFFTHAHLRRLKQVDTAILTGELFPRKVPDYEQKEEEGSEEDDTRGGETKSTSADRPRPRVALWAGCIIKTGEAYCRVEATGLRTEVGKAAKSIQANAAARRRSLFEAKILVVANTIIAITAVVVVAMLVV